jgi:hypothetical protein
VVATRNGEASAIEPMLVIVEVMTSPKKLKQLRHEATCNMLNFAAQR